MASLFRKAETELISTTVGPLRVKKVAEKSENATKSILNAVGRGAELVWVNKEVIARHLIYDSFGGSRRL